ncbi:MULTISPECIES: hypothetical protein [unclassified Bradyrhizobium]
MPAQKAARRLHLTETEFREKLHALQRAGFPAACSVTGHYDLKAIDAWLDARAGIGDYEGKPKRNVMDGLQERLALIGKPESALDVRANARSSDAFGRPPSEKPLGLNEKRGLSGYYAKRHGPPTSVYGCGPGTIGKLLTRGYIEMFEEQLSSCKITPEGEAAWLAIADREGKDF